MALRFLFPRVPHKQLEVDDDGGTFFFGKALKVYDLPALPGYTFTSRSVYDGFSQFTAGPKAAATPPYHYHIYQAELFIVNKGEMAYILDGKHGILSAGEELEFPPLIPHTFYCVEGKNLDLTISVKGGPPNRPGFDDTFRANFLGTISSAVTEGKSPNPIQMIRYLHSADIVLADVPFGLGRVVNVLIGVIVGGWLAGYDDGKTEYPSLVVQSTV